MNYKYSHKWQQCNKINVCIVLHKCFDGWWLASAYQNLLHNFWYTIFPILACLYVIITKGKLSDQKILRSVKLLSGQFPKYIYVKFEIIFSKVMHYYLYYNFFITINDQCETVVLSLLHSLTYFCMLQRFILLKCNIKGQNKWIL